METLFYAVPKSEDDHSKVELMGYTSSKIFWDLTIKAWKLTNILSNTTIAFTNQTEVIPLGTHTWHFLDGKCKDDHSNAGRSMNLHFKVDHNKFCCNDGTCIEWTLRCDNVPNCNDESDEQICDSLILPEGYDENKPPTNKILFSDDYSANLKTDVRVRFVILDLYDINEKESTITVRYQFVREWSDPRLQFRDLSWDDTRNTIDIKSIWYPRFEKPSNLKTLITTEYNGVVVKRKNNFTKFNDKKFLLKSRIFSGVDNTIVMSETHQVEVFCIFEQLAMYPFDEEKCEINVAMKERFTNFINILPQVIDDGPTSFSEYTIKEWNVNLEKNGSKTRLRLGLRLKRNAGMIIMIVYLPTILMTIINQSINYLSSGENKDFGYILEVNVTCMIVLAMIYSSVSTGLVPTPHIKMVEIWLISSLIYPFICIIINIRLRLLGKESTTKGRNNSNVKKIKVGEWNPTMNKENLENGQQLDEATPNDLGVSKSKEAHRLQFIAFYVLPAVYILFIIIYFIIIMHCV